VGASPPGLSLPVRPLSTTITVSASGAATPEQAWARYAMPARWHEWSPQIADVECADPDAVVVAGLVGTVSGPLGVRVRFRVVEVDEAARRWTWHVRAGIVELAMAHGVEVLAAGTRAWVAITGPLPLVLSYAPAARLALGRLVAEPAA
jgi:hypothetical protein